MRFWLERGVDGFRLDAVNYYLHDHGELTDNPPRGDIQEGFIGVRPDNPYRATSAISTTSTQPENLAFLERMRALLDEYPGHHQHRRGRRRRFRCR